MRSILSKRFLLPFLLACFAAVPAHAEKVFAIRHSSTVVTLPSPSCEAVRLARFSASNITEFTCPAAMDTAFKNAVTNFTYGIEFYASYKQNGTPLTSSRIEVRVVSGACALDANPQGPHRISTGFWTVLANGDAGEEVQHIRNVADVTLAKNGCTLYPKALTFCGYTEEEVVNGIVIAYCDATFAEDGTNAGADSTFSDEIPEYTGPIPGDGGEDPPACDPATDPEACTPGDPTDDPPPPCDPTTDAQACTPGDPTDDPPGGGGSDPGGGDTGGGGTDTGGDPGDGDTGDGEPCGTSARPCKLDESGTPSGTGAYGAANTGADAMFDDLDGIVSSAASPENKDTRWAFAFALPSGCTPIELFLGVALNPCQFQPQMHALMSMVWIMATIVFSITMVGATLRGR